MGKRWLVVTTSESASTCAKSGLTARSKVIAEEATNLAVTPGSKPSGSLTKRPRKGSSRARTRRPVSETVRLGMISSVRSGEISSRPVSLPAVESVPELSRGIGIHESISSLLRSMLRHAWKPHCFPFPAS